MDDKALEQAIMSYTLCFDCNIAHVKEYMHYTRLHNRAQYVYWVYLCNACYQTRHIGSYWTVYLSREDK